MANLLNKDPFTYHQEYTEFIRELRGYHINRGTPFIKIPQIAGRDVDLYLLYRRVIALGGWQKFAKSNYQYNPLVNDEQNWDEFLEEFNVPKGCTNGIQALKQIYIRFLNEYEKVHFLGEDPDHEIMDDEEDGPSRKKSSTPLHSVPLTYKYSQHKVSDNMRRSSGLSCQFVTFSDYEKLEMALLSGLPNEVDFVVNVCTLLSNDGKRSLRLDKSKHLLDLLLAHIGIFTSGGYSLEGIYESGWKPLSNRNFVKFWYDTVHDKEVREMISVKRDASHLRQWVGEEVLNLGRDLGVNDVEGQRVTQMAIIIRNLSFDEENMQVLASNRNVFRFLLLCIYSKYGSLRQIGLDTLGNSALQMVLESVDNPDTQLILRLVSKCLSSNDKCEVVRGLEILSKLCQVEENESVLSEHLESKAYEDICKLLTVHDIQLIIYTLEALYQLSELGESTANAIASVKHSVDILVQLVTVEAQSYGPNSLIGIKVVEFVPHQSAGGATVGPPVPPQPPPPLTMSSKVISPPGAPPSPEIETTCNWLRANIELKDGNYMSHLSLYTDYLSFCKKFSLPNPLNSSVLHTCVKAVFPNVDEKIIERKDGNKDIQFSGFSKRQTPLPFAITWQVDKPPSIHSSHGFQRASNSSQSCLTHTPTLRQRLLEPPLVHLQPDSCPPFPAGSSSTHSSQVPGVQHATMTVGANPVTPHTPKSHHVQSSQQKHCAKLLQSPGTPLRTSLASPSTSAPSTPVSRPLVVSTLPSLVSSSPAGKTVSVLQQQLRSPIAQQSLKLQDSAQSAASPNQHYPCIQHALHSEQDQNANQGSLRQQSRPNMQGKNGNISFQDNSGTAGRNSSETNLIKSLLAKKLNQNRGTQNPTGQQYQCHESPGSNATPVCNAPPSPARSDAAVSQDDFPMLETKPCIKAPLQTGSVGWTQQQPIDSPAQSDTMESQTSISQDSQYTDDQSSIETKATEQQVTGKEQVAKEIKCDGPFQEESMEVDTSLSNSQQKSLESGQLTSQEGLKEQSAGDIQCESTTQDADGSLSMPAKEPPNSVSVSVSVQNPHLEEQSTMKNTQNPQQSHLQPNPDASKSSVSSEPIVIQAAQQLEHSLVMQPASKLTTPQQKSAELVIQVGSEPSLQQQEVVIQPATDQLNNEDLVIQAQLQDQQDVMQPMTPHQQGEQFVIQGSQILIQQPPTQQQLLIQVPAQPAQPIQPAQQLVIQTTPPAAAQQTQQLVIQVPPQQQQFVIQAQQSSSSSPQAQQQFQQQIVIRDLPEDSSQEMMPENQQFEGLQQSNFSQQSPVQFGQDQIQLLGQSQLPATNSQTANTTNTNTLYSQPQKSVYQSVDSSLQQNQVVIQYQPVSQSATTASLPTLPKVSPASPGEASLDSSLSPQTLTKCVFQSQGHLFPSSQNIQLENSQKSKKGRTSPVNKNTSVHTCRAMVKSTVPKQKLTQISDSTIPYTSSPCSPRALEIEVCGEVECAKDIVKEGAEARIQRVENKCLRLFDRPVEPSNVENTESSQAPGIVGNAKELPDSVTKNNLLPCADHKKLLHNHTHSIPSTNTELKDKIAEPPVAFVYSTDTVPKRNVEFVGSNTCHNLHDSSTCHLHRPLSSSKVKEEKSAVADSVIKMECPNSNTVQTKKEEQTILSHDTSAENENLGPKQTASIKCESPKPNRTVYAPVAQVNGAAPATSDASVARPVPQCTHGRAVDESSKLCSSEQLHNGLATSSPTATETKLNLNEVKKSEELSVNEKTILHKPVDRLGKVNGIINHLGNNECKPSLDTKTVVLADNQNQKERKRKASVSSLSPNSSSSNSSSTVARVPENGCVVNGLQENVNINDCKFLTDNNNIERTATNLNSGSCAKKHRQSEVTGNISLKKKSEKSNTSVVCSYVNRTCESRLVAPPPDSGDGDISCDSSSVSSVQDAFDKQHSNLNQGLPGTLLSKDNKDTALRPGQSISPKGGTGGNLDKSAKARKRIRNNTGSGDSRCSSSASTEFVCEWANCKRCFESSKSVYSHVYSAHVVTESDGICKWEGCEKLERKKWSLVTHIQDQHCSEAALRAAGQRRIQSVQMNLSGAVAHAAPPTQSQPPPPLQVSPAAASVSAPCVATPGSGASGVVGTGVAAAAAPGTANLVYPPDAAIQAIRRFSARPPFPELMPTNHVPYPVHYQRYDFKPRNPEYIFMEMQFNNNPVFQEPREGPVTKHIRLTAALILRNLSRYSTLGRRLLKKHETYLGYTAMSAVESSNALANCLWEILQKH